MKRTLKYAALNLSVPSMSVLLLMFLGVFAEGTLNRFAAMLICAVLGLCIRAVWQEILRMDAQAKQAKRAARRASVLRAQVSGAKTEQTEKPHALRVA